MYCLLVNEDNVLKIEYKNKDRTVLNVENTGLSLLALSRDIKRCVKCQGGRSFLTIYLLKPIDKSNNIKKRNLNKKYKNGKLEILNKREKSLEIIWEKSYNNLCLFYKK